jgi:hypothetical protein
MSKTNGFTDMKPPADYSQPNWAVDAWLEEPDADNKALWFVVIGALQMLIGISIGFWFGTL